MYVGALGMGLTTSDLRSMPPDRLMWFIHEHNLLQGGGGDDSGESYRDGTVDELKGIL